MVMLTDLARVLRAAGLKVVEVDGWKTRGYRHRARPNGDVVDVRGIVCHHTATPWSATGNYPSLRIVRDGRSDVPGPLAQLGLGRDGTWYVIAAGFANHAGKVRDDGYGSSHTLGIEAEAAGTGDPRDWPEEQVASYARGVAALQAHYSGAWVKGHKEICAPVGRKIDPSFDMAAFRKRVAGVDLGEREGGASRDDDRDAAPAGWDNRGYSKAWISTQQAKLNRLGYDLVVDGKRGPATIAATKSFQATHRLTQDGIPGPATAKKLDAAVAARAKAKHHRRTTTAPTHVYAGIGTKRGRLLPKGYPFTVVNGSGTKVGKTWWVQTTAGNWVRGAKTTKAKTATKKKG